MKHQPVPNESNEIPVLNGIRALAVITVFVAHSMGIYFDGFLFGRGSGQLGVMLFFTLSGFLMGYLYLGKNPSKRDLFDFVVKRLSRVYPMFLVTAVACFAALRLGILRYAYDLSSGRELFATLALHHGNAVLWTIGPEIIFYGLFMVLWPLWHRSRMTFWIVVGMLMLLAWLPIDIQPTNSIAALHDRIPYFVGGMFLGLNARRFAGTIAQTYFWIAIAGFFFGSPQVAGLLIPISPRVVVDPWSFPLYAVLVGALLIVSLLTRPPILLNPIASYIGRISFSFYLVHLLFLVNLKDTLANRPVLAILLSLAGSLVTSSVRICLSRLQSVEQLAHTSRHRHPLNHRKFFAITS